jgi:hypothetical protein
VNKPVASVPHAALLHVLHNKGVVFYSPNLFHESFILDQYWALDAVYAVCDCGSTYPLITANDGRISLSLFAAELTLAATSRRGPDKHNLYSTAEFAN